MIRPEFAVAVSSCPLAARTAAICRNDNAGHSVARLADHGKYRRRETFVAAEIGYCLLQRRCRGI